MTKQTKASIVGNPSISGSSTEQNARANISANAGANGRGVVKRAAQGQRVGYVRVSSLDQNPARQLEHLEGLPEHMALDRVFTDHASGKDTSRPQLEALLNWTSPDKVDS